MTPTQLFASTQGIKNEPSIKIEPSVDESKFTHNDRTSKGENYPIFGAIACIIASSVGAVLIVYLSDGRPIASWTARPSVLLAILASVIAVSLAFLFSIALSISWWGAAVSGATVEHLDRIWDRMFWLRRSTWRTTVFRTNGFKRLAVMSLLVPIGNFLYNPLLQLSTSASHTGDELDVVPMTLDILPEIPRGLAALTYSGTNARMDFSAAAAQWYRKDPIRTKDLDGYKCTGVCRGTVIAPGIAVSCSNETSSIDLTTSSPSDRYFFAVNQTYTRTADNFIVHTLKSTYTPETSRNCVANVIMELCQIEIAQIEYKIEIRGTQIVVLPRRWFEWTSNNVSRTEPHDAPTLLRPGPLWALGFMGNYFGSWSGWEANATTLTSFGVLTEQLFVYTPQESVSACDFEYQWSSPTEYVLNGIGETLFRLAMNGNSVTKLSVAGAPDGVFPQPQNFQAFRTRETIFYRSNYRWLGAALGTVLLALLALSTVLLGSRLVPRTATLSPVETFQVFIPQFATRTEFSQSVGLRAKEILELFGGIRLQPRSTYAPIATEEA